MSTNTPNLPLYKVLEEEYVRLHKGTPPVYPDKASDDQKLKEVIKLIHGRKPSAFCISGGGIRSATFALGIIQGLARCGVLDKFDYLSTVSGGGYIGSWLTGWLHRHGMDEVMAELTARPKSPVTPEPGPVSKLRDYSNYLNPKLGLLSADTWTLVATILRNLLLNWFVLIPLLAAALMIPRAGIPIIHQTSTEGELIACLIAACALLAWAIGYIGVHRPSYCIRRGDQKSFLKFCFVPLVLAAILFVTYWAWYRKLHRQEGDIPELAVFIVFGIAISLVGFLGGLSLRLNKVTWNKVWEALIVIFTGALSGVMIWWVATSIFPLPDNTETTLLLYVCFSAPVFLVAILLAESVYVGLSSYLTSDHDREWWARSGAWVLIYIVVWSAVSVLLIFGPMVVLKMGVELKATAASVGGLSGLITILAGRSGKTPSQADSEQKKKQETTGLKAVLMKYGLALAAPLFAIFLVVLIALGAELLLHWGFPPEDGYKGWLIATKFTRILIFIIGVALVGLLMGWFININKFSLHAMYRNRLIRAYLGASREHRDPNLFTGFDDDDNIQMYWLWPNAPQPPKSETRCKHGNHGPVTRQPFHVINMALNLVGGENLAWQQRKAESFTVSPLHAGCYRENVGYRRTEYNVDGKKYFYGGREGISLGTAVAISGAAANPNMGYHSSPVITFLMTLFNARLGWWLGNTGSPAGNHTFDKSGPVMAARPLIEEALGLTDDKNKYINLSDGGHFENLALYEMVLRRCHTIVVSDAGQDGDFKFQDLGSAVRKIRIDFGIPITFEKGIRIYSRTENKKGYYCAIGTIGYSCVDDKDTDGRLIYIKPTFYGDEPRDVYQYAKGNEAFPHDSTADQWFDESQFESYRMLGSYIVNLICEHDDEDFEAGRRETSIDDFVQKVREYLDRDVEQQPA